MRMRGGEGDCGILRAADGPRQRIPRAAAAPTHIQTRGRARVPRARVEMARDSDRILAAAAPTRKPGPGYCTAEAARDAGRAELSVTAQGRNEYGADPRGPRGRDRPRAGTGAHAIRGAIETFESVTQTQ